MKYLTLNVFYLLAVKASIPEEVLPYPTKGKVIDASSYPLKDSNSFADCPCDVTAGGCDEACCCDKDCDAAILKIWKSEGGICHKENQA